MTTPKIEIGDHDSHLDFLEAHGAITADEREAQRKFSELIEKHPELFKTQTFETFLAEVRNDCT